MVEDMNFTYLKTTDLIKQENVILPDKKNYVPLISMPDPSKLPVSIYF